MPILRKESGNPCFEKSHLMPEPDLNKFGLGTIAACDRCGRQARLGLDKQVEGGGPIWIWLLPEDYIQEDTNG